MQDDNMVRGGRARLFGTTDGGTCQRLGIHQFDLERAIAAKEISAESYADPALKGVAQPHPNVRNPFQIICAGPDGDFGTPGDKRSHAARDNISSFDDASLEDP